ncbi:hypothetical protein ACA040_002236 [Xenophilus aerolatus]
MKQSISVNEIQVPVDKIRGLSIEQRHAYYLLGFICNELVSLQKLISWTLQQSQLSDPGRAVLWNAEMSQTLMLFRVACAKCWEAKEKINSVEVASVLQGDVFPKWEDGPLRLKEVNKAVAAADWINHIRNTLAFHYPSLDNWRRNITPSATWVDDIHYVGEQSGNTFYDAANSVVLHHMFGKRAESSASVRMMIDEMIGLLTLMSNFVESALGTFIEHTLGEQIVGGPTHHIAAPSYWDIHIPFWTSMTQRESPSADARRQMQTPHP